MSAEIVEAVKLLGKEKGIPEEKLMQALEDALLSAYKKQPGAAQYARVEMDRETADFLNTSPSTGTLRRNLSVLSLPFDVAR